MAMTLVKSEEKNVRRSYSHGDSVAKSEEKNLRRSYSQGDSMANGTPEVARRVKRRRREAAAAGVLSDGSNGHLAAKGVVNHEADAAPTTVKRSSRFRGVSRHRWTGRYEAHLWDKLSWNVTQKKKGKQVYLGAYDDEEAAARAYDLAALKYWGASTFTNFPISDYETEVEIMKTVTKEEYLASLRRKSSGFSRGVSKYRGVARHHHNGRWEARIGRVFGNKYLYLGTYSTQEEAARAYDIAAIEYRGINAVTNFELSTYIRWLKPGANIPCSPAQEAKPNHDFATLTWMDPHQPLSPCLKRQAFSMNDLQETEMLGRSSLPCSRSSPTALGLLLRSSVFRQLVEKSALLSMEGEKSGTNEVCVCGGKSSMFGEEDNIGDFVRIEGEIPVDYGCPHIVGDLEPVIY